MSFNDFLNSESVKSVKSANSDFNKLLSREELMNVYGCIDRLRAFADAKKVLTNIIHRKRTDPKAVYLSSVYIKSSVERYPPINTYEYIFSDSRPQIEGSVNPGRYDEPIFKGTCLIL